MNGLFEEPGMTPAPDPAEGGPEQESAGTAASGPDPTEHAPVPPVLPAQPASTAAAQPASTAASQPASPSAAEPAAPAADLPAPAPAPVAAPPKPPRPRAAPTPPPAPAAPAVPVVAQWYPVRVQSNKEESVKRNMERRIELRGLGKKILHVVVPTEKIAEIKNGKKRTRQVKTYPGYVLVEMIMDDETWAFVRETGGVGDFVGGGGNIHQKPFPLRQDEVNKIFGIDVPGTDDARIKIDFGVGDKVKIRDGPFENFDGVVEEINEQKGLVRVVVTIFGRATPVELKYWEVEVI